MLARIRKAVIAGVGAGAAAVVAALVQSATEGNVNRDEVSRAIGLGVAAAVSVGWAAWRVPNAPAVSR
ncbi:hypothetical protein OHA21_43890 [Actinoplanes sp. NBC_00393]|uniref:hypothetical protein n=1 Tax=Actinoplanes sp. NBC_00393 TaxID=2975953 RepID=UPI002E1B82A3